MNLGLLAAVEVGRLFGISSDHPVLIQESDNTVVWLSPQPVIAKVATRADSAEGLVREHEVAVALDALKAPVGRPLKGSSPLQHRSTGFTVTLWERLERDPNGITSGEMLGPSLRQVHEALALSGIDLPDFRLWLRRARSALSNDVLLDALAKEDVAFLRSAFDALLIQLDTRTFSLQPLHGEPHDGNRIMTPSGLRWIDFESVVVARWNGTSYSSQRMPAMPLMMSNPNLWGCSQPSTALGWRHGAGSNGASPKCVGTQSTIYVS